MANVIDQQYTTNNDEWSLRNTTSFTKLAMSFTPTVTAKVTQATLKLRKIGSPTGNVTIDIFNNSAGVPGSVVAASNATLDVSTIAGTTGGTEYTLTIAPTTLNSGTKYWIVLSGTYTINNTDFIDWREDDLAGFAGGAGFKMDGSNAWTALADNGDFYFKEYYDDTTILNHFMTPNSKFW